MERKIKLKLQNWYKEATKPLLVYGIKGAGKTYSVIDFLESSGINYIYLDSSNNSLLEDIFLKEKTPAKIINRLKLLTIREISEKDVIVIDNLESKEIFEGVKLFLKENSNRFILITNLKENLLEFKGQEYNYLEMSLVDFEEFLIYKDNKALITSIRDSFKSKTPMAFHQLALDLYEEYLFTGGFPEVIFEENPLKRKMIYQKIIDGIKSSFFDTENSQEILRIFDVFLSMPYQLMKKNRKFQYGLLKRGGRSKEYDLALTFLHNNNFINKCYKTSTVKSPISFYRDKDNFKAYFLDTGLLFYMMNMNELVLNTSKNIKESLYENNLAYELLKNNFNLHYFQSQGRAEVSFVIENQMGKIIAVDLVLNSSSKAKNIQVLRDSFKIDEVYKVSFENFKVEKDSINIPVYASFCIK